MTAAKILPGFWHDRLAVNADSAIFHQWEQLERSGCIENFRIAAGKSDGFREGWFFADSDAFKWLDAASRVYRSHPRPRLDKLINNFVTLIGEAQEPDGYLYTYNQIHFPDTRWANLQIEHELYCHGHLIEAGVSHYQATGRTALLSIAQKAADLITRDFRRKGPLDTPGHQEIEIALLRLYRVTGQKDYLELAQQFIEKRGRIPKFGLEILKQNSAVARREKTVKTNREAFLAAHPTYTHFQVPAGNEAKKPWNIALRWIFNAFTGKYFQQHIPVRSQTVPVGHSVRFAYLETATTLLARETADSSLLPPLERCWDHMISNRMYITGGIGSLPALEGFGKDYELDPEIAYAETCAALGSMFWNWEMALLTSEAKYSDLFEWQLYNASAVGMGLDGKGYFYNNPLSCRGGVSRQAWYEIPCCPSNISRTWADLGKYIYAHNEKEIWVHQYIDSSVELENLNNLNLKVKSGLPWRGEIHIEINPKANQEISIHLRVPSWASHFQVEINGKLSEINSLELSERDFDQTASGYDPRLSSFWTIQRTWSPGDVIKLIFDLEVKLRRAHPKVKGHQGKIAITRGPVVYCLEGPDNPGVDLFDLQLELGSLANRYDPDLLGGTQLITGRTAESHPLIFIPYHLWGNRGPSEMTVWVRSIERSVQ